MSYTKTAQNSLLQEQTQKQMLRQLREASEFDETSQNETSQQPQKPITQQDGNSDRDSYSETDEVFKTFKKGVREQIQTTSASFNVLYYHKRTQKVQWSGTIANGVEWSTYYGNDGKGFFITAENVQLSSDDTKAILKLCLYFETKWAEAIQAAIDNKDFTNKKQA